MSDYEEEAEETVRSMETEDRERYDWSVRHVAHLWRYAVIGFVTSMAVAFSTVALYSLTGGTLPVGWGGFIPLIGASGGLAGASIAFWEDVRGATP